MKWDKDSWFVYVDFIEIKERQSQRVSRKTHCKIREKNDLDFFINPWETKKIDYETSVFEHRANNMLYDKVAKLNDVVKCRNLKRVTTKRRVVNF